MHKINRINTLVKVEVDKNSATYNSFTKFLEKNNFKKTPERYAIWDVLVCSKEKMSLDDINHVLLEKGVFISRGTLYNTIRLLLKARLVVKHQFMHSVLYEVSEHNQIFCQQICTQCGKVKELRNQNLDKLLIKNTSRGFRTDHVVVNMYGLCNKCRKMAKQ